MTTSITRQFASCFAISACLAARVAGAQSAGLSATPERLPVVEPTTRAAVGPTIPASLALTQASELGRAFSDVAAQVLPAVAFLQVDSEADMQQFAGFSPFFGDQAPDGSGARPIVHGSGSGVVLRDDGVILTNYHVIERARRISVHLRDGRIFRGRVLGADRSTDLALVKIDARGLPTVRLGDSDGARAGEWVLALGAPLGLEASVTHGVISATGRANLGINDIEDYLQTDASINPGNSGGPLINLRGEVLGINTMIAGRNSGIGFAVSSRIAQFVVDQVLRTGRVQRGWVGVAVQDVTPALAQNLGIGSTNGAMISAVDNETPAGRAGVRLGDIVTRIDNEAITSAHDFVRTITRKPPGEHVAITVMRGTQMQLVNVTTTHRPGPEDVPVLEIANTNVRRSQGHGIRIATIDPRLLERLHIREPALGVIDVEAGSAADDAGVRRGDIILRVDGAAPTNARALDEAARDRRLTLLVRRRDGQLFLPLVLE